MARISLKGKGTMAEISALLREQIPEVSHGVRLAEYLVRGGTELIVFEKYGSKYCSLTLSLMLTQNGDELVVDSVSAGEMDNLFGFNWALEDDFAFETSKLLAPLGFAIFDRSIDFVEPWQMAEAPDPEPIGDIMRKALDARAERASNGESVWTELKKDEAERVTLGREEKKPRFGKKRNKPDWEY